jgi:hypothetical protein
MACNGTALLFFTFMEVILHVIIYFLILIQQISSVVVVVKSLFPLTNNLNILVEWHLNTLV